MRRLMSLAAFALLLTVPVWAQRGGHGGGGGHAGGFGGHAGGGHFGGGFSGGHSGGFSSGMHFSGHSAHGPSGNHFSGVRSGPASRGFSRGSLHARRDFSRAPFLHDRFRDGRRFRDRFRTFGFRNNCFGYPCRYGWGYGYGPYYDPWLWDWWSDSSSPSHDDEYYNDLQIANQMNQQSLEEQRMRRQEDEDGDQDLYNQRASVDPSNSAVDAPSGESFLPSTVLVFRDAHKEEIRNYAIVGQTLWNFAPQHTEKIPLSELDIPATSKANDERGVTFRVPVSGEAQ